MVILDTLKWYTTAWWVIPAWTIPTARSWSFWRCRGIDVLVKIQIYRMANCLLLLTAQLMTAGDVMSQRQVRHLRFIHLRNRMIMNEDIVRRISGLVNVQTASQPVRRRLRESGLRARRPVVGPILKQRHILVHTLVRKTFPTPAVHTITFSAKTKWNSGFITKKDVLPGVKPPTTTCTIPG
jgi:hypothetical protein